MSAIKLRIFPNDEQNKIFLKWFGASRFIYNKCLSYINDEVNKKQRKINDILDIKTLRLKFINNPNYVKENKWMLDIPYSVRDEALRDLLKNYKSNFAKKVHFQIRYKKRKLCNSISVLSKYWNLKTGIYSKILTSSLKCERKLPVNLDYDSRIIKDDLGNYFICIPKLRKIQDSETIDNNDNNDNQVISKISKKELIVSIDPGVKTFATCFDQTGKVIKFGTGDIIRLSKLSHYKNKLQGSITKIRNHSTRYRYKKALLRLSHKITNLVQDIHKKLALWLCQNYNTILIPKLNFHNFKQMSKKNRNKMALWSHCSFVDRLIDKSKDFKKCNVIIVKEDYTSKTCGQCGTQKKDLGSSDTFNCDKCKLCIDRDTSGSRNILLKYSTEHISFIKNL